MKRRAFIGAAVGGAAALGGAVPRAAKGGQRPAPKRALMKAGTQHGDDDATLRVLGAFGVNHLCSRLPRRPYEQGFSVESLSRLRERVESFGLKLDMIPLPMSSSSIERAELPNILLGKSPEREREIDLVCQILQNCQKVGIPSVKYNLTFLGVLRTESTRGRGGARYSTFVYEKAKQDPPLTLAGPVSEDLYWERITYFLDRVVPVATTAKVRIACHPQDPGMPKGRGYRGVETVLGSVDGLKRFISIRESPYHGLNFCQGTVSEMLKDPNRELPDVIRYFGARRKIFNVHFRNIQGGFLDFRETFPDDGDVDMIRCMRVYKEVGYDGMIMPDHVPTIEGDEGKRQAFAFAFGYIQALIQLVNQES